MKKIVSIQEQTDLIIALFIQIEKIRQTNVFPIRINFQQIFYQLKQKFPEHFQRLRFTSSIYSTTLEDIFSTFNVCGIREWTDREIFINTKNRNFKKICQKLSVKEKDIKKIAQELVKLINEGG